MKDEDGVRMARFSNGVEEFLVLSFPALPLGLPPGLTAAEREVVCGALEGKSNAEIARERGTSSRTVANQLAKAFQKLEVQSRGELLIRCGGQPKRGASAH